MMRSSYKSEDVELLLKDITGLVRPLPAKVRETEIQKGMHYCEMLPLEYKPGEKYMEAYRFALDNYSKATADALAVMAEKIYRKKGNNLVIVSLARAGIPIGILAKRYIEKRHGCKIKHYSVSIIRDRGIDRNAVNHILQRHKPEDIQFLDGWVGKGAIFGTLCRELEFYPEIDRSIAVVADPAGITELCGTHEDILIPSSCLNAAVTGLISRTFLRDDIIGSEDFHGAAYYGEFEDIDLSEEFLTAIENHFDYDIEPCESEFKQSGIETIRRIAVIYGIDDINFIKPGTGETTRVLLRRIPWKVLINERYADSAEISHILRLAEEKNVPVEISRTELGSYKTCGIIKKLADL